MKVVFEKIPSGADPEEVIRAHNRMVEQLNMVLGEIDEENISDTLMKKINKEE